MAIERDIRDGRMPLFSHNLIRYRPKNILYLQSSQSEMNRRALDGVRRFASKAGWNLTALHYGAAAKAGDRAGSFCSPRVLGEVLAGRRPDGCIVEDSAVWKRMIPVMEKSRVPCVIYDAQFPAALSGGFTRVICDNVAVVDAAVKELFSFGLDDYAVVPHHEPLAWSKIREDAFRKAVARHFARCHVYRNSERNINVVSSGLVDWLRRLPRPCGLFAVNDQTAIRVLEAADAGGVSVPADLVVIGADDDLSKCETAIPTTLSSVRIDVEGGGYAAAEALEECIRSGHSRTEDRYFGVAYLARRSSSRKLRVHDARVQVALETIRRCVQAGRSIGVEEVAQKVRMPLRTLHRRFVLAVGHTLGQEIREMRFELAKRQLTTGSLSIDAIAEFCGYDSASTLRKLFGRRLGCSPLRWRKDECQKLAEKSRF